MFHPVLRASYTADRPNDPPRRANPAIGDPAVARERAKALAEALLKELGVSKGERGRLHEVPVKTLITALAPARQAVGSNAWPLLTATISGRWSTARMFRRTHSTRPRPVSPTTIPLVIGNTKDEAFLVPGG
jgi:carboxylesterase type B